MKFIETLREGERINEIYLCKFKQAALTKSGKPYDNVILQDKTEHLMPRSGIRVPSELMSLMRWIMSQSPEMSQAFR